MGLGREWEDLTIRELFREFVIAARRTREERRLDLWRAWHLAVLSRAKEIPPLSELMRSMHTQTPEERNAVWRQIGAMYGKVRKHNPRRVRIVRMAPQGTA